VRLHAADVGHLVLVTTCAQGNCLEMGLKAGLAASVAAVAELVEAAFGGFAALVAASAAGTTGYRLVLWCHPEVFRQCSAEDSHSYIQADLQTSVQVLQFVTGTASAEEPEDDVVLPARRPEMVWVELVM
jgi:hypothetical protein